MCVLQIYFFFQRRTKDEINNKLIDSVNRENKTDFIIAHAAQKRKTLFVVCYVPCYSISRLEMIKVIFNSNYHFNQFQSNTYLSSVLTLSVLHCCLLKRKHLFVHKNL